MKTIRVMSPQYPLYTAPKSSRTIWPLLQFALVTGDVVRLAGGLAEGDDRIERVAVAVSPHEPVDFQGDLAFGHAQANELEHVVEAVRCDRLCSANELDLFGRLADPQASEQISRRLEPNASEALQQAYRVAVEDRVLFETQSPGAAGKQLLDFGGDCRCVDGGFE